jgi:ParB family chromosome partitioning protein
LQRSGACPEEKVIITFKLPFIFFSFPQDAEALEASPAWKAIEKESADWQARLPASKDKLFDWLFMQTQKVQLQLLAVYMAMTINGKGAANREIGASIMDKLANALKLDMGAWWKPTQESYFHHVPKTYIAQLIAETISLQAGFAIAGMKKAAAAEMAERYLVDTKWVPDNLRCQKAA